MALNRCEFIGNLGKDPEIMIMPDGRRIAKFSIAVTETWKDKQGEKQQKTEWISCVCFGPLATVIENYVKKGHKVYIAGKHMTNHWEDDAGNTRYRTEINIRELEMLTAKSDNQSSQQSSSNYQQPARPASNPATPNPNSSDDEVDDLPF